jgi:hypothetical protein
MYMQAVVQLARDGKREVGAEKPMAHFAEKQTGNIR